VSVFLSNDPETPSLERHQHIRSEVVRHLNGKLFLQGYNTKLCSPSQKVSPVTMALMFSRFDSGLFLGVHNTLFL